MVNCIICADAALVAPFALVAFSLIVAIVLNTAFAVVLAVILAHIAEVAIAPVRTAGVYTALAVFAYGSAEAISILALVNVIAFAAVIAALIPLTGTLPVRVQRMICHARHS